MSTSKNTVCARGPGDGRGGHRGLPPSVHSPPPQHTFILHLLFVRKSLWKKGGMGARTNNGYDLDHQEDGGRS